MYSRNFRFTCTEGREVQLETDLHHKSSLRVLFLFAYQSLWISDISPRQMAMKPKDLFAWTFAIVVSVLLVAVTCFLLIDWYHADFSRLGAVLLLEQKFQLTRFQQAGFVVLIAALPATFIVWFFRSTRGDLEFSALGVRFKGPSGPILLWVVSFLAIAAVALAYSSAQP